jgi:hypothetical protein
MLPELHLADWRATKDTLHLYCQIVGKIRMASTPPRNHWWHVPLYVDARGLTTRRMHNRDTTFEIGFDFVDHALAVATADGRSGGFALRDGLSVADFDAQLHGTLADLGIDVEIEEEPFGVPMTTPFGEDSEHASWDRDAGERFGRILDWSDAVLDEGLREQPLSAGAWIEFGSGSLAVLPYETVRTAPDSRTTLLAFCQSAYEAGSGLARWDTAGFESAWCPTPSQLDDLHAGAAAMFGRAPTPQTPERSAP